MPAAPPEVRRALVTLARAALDAVAPATLVAGALALRGGRRPVLTVRRRGAAPRALPLDHGLLVVGAGKGAAAMAAAVESALGPAVSGGLVIVPPGHARPLRRIRVATGAHPLPDGASVRATRRLLGCLAATPRAAVLVVLTGGASSLLCLPHPAITLADKRRVGRLLLACGASIHEANTVRRHLSAVKGGRLAARLARRPAAALVVSDVPGDDLAVVGSGPTVADRTVRADARRVLERYGLWPRVPARVRRHLARAAAPCRAGVPTLLLGGNASARRGAARAARRAGCAPVVVLRRPITGDTTAAAEALARRIVRLQAVAPGRAPAVLVGGGETTVTLGPDAGRGGRNQELALVVARRLAGRAGWALLTVATDGVDGPTDAAGAWVDGATVARSAATRRAVERALGRHDVFPLLGRLGALWRPGPTGTNVADLQIALVWRDRGWRLPPALR